jgi:hypothetical protein
MQFKITKAWHVENTITISRSWKVMVPDNIENECLGSDEETYTTAGLAATLKHMDGCENFEIENSEQWF